MSAPTREEFLAANITPTDLSSEDTRCSICYEEYDPTTTHTAVTFSDPTSCNHVFGQECIVYWLDTQRMNSCPCCRRELFVAAQEDSRVDSDYGSGEETEFESDSSDWDSDLEEDDDDDDIPLSYLYRNERAQNTTEIPIPVLLTLLETTWYKTWNLLHTFITEIEEAYKDSPIPLNPLYFNRYLPTMSMLLNSFLNTVYVQLGQDISSMLNERKIRALELLLENMIDYQRCFISVHWTGTRLVVGDTVPFFPKYSWVPVCSWVLSMKEVMGTLPVVAMAREEGWVISHAIR